MQRRLFVGAFGSAFLVWSLWTETVRAETPAPLAPFQFLLGEWEGQVIRYAVTARSREAFAPYLSWTARKNGAPQTALADPLQPLAFMIGRWEGTSNGQPGSAQVQREYSRILNSRFIRVQNRSVYQPQEKNPKGEVHEDLGMFSFDSARQRLVFRQFHEEGFVNQYVHDPGPTGKVVFTTEAIENIPAGWRARETYVIHGTDEFEEIFELAEAGKTFEVYSHARFTRAQ